MLLPFFALAVMASQQAPAPQTLLNSMRTALSTGSESKLQSLFVATDGANYLLRMAKNRGGLQNLKVCLIPSPPGWNDEKFWAVFHTFQDIEEDHDAVYRVLPTGDGLRLGSEVPEDAAAFNRITDADLSVSVSPSQNSAAITANLKMTGGGAQAPLFRLNDVYSVSACQVGTKDSLVVTADDNSIPTVSLGQTLRAGGLLIPWTTSDAKSVKVTYSGVVDQRGEDSISDSICYLTAWWVPSTARLPFTTKVTITAPKEWEVRSEGILIGRAENGDQQVTSYRCDIPITYPKVVGGKYKLVASKTDNGKLYRAYQLDPINEDRAKQTVDSAASAVKYFEDLICPFPFPGYDVFESDNYYGIESYSYTLLQKGIVGWATSHEIGHTYFGGMANAPYVQDSWNEGLTQYIDSVLYKKDADRTLELGMRSLKEPTPLSKMPVAHDYGSQSYYRGAFVMKMLENEIGLDAVRKGMKSLVLDRRGKGNTWSDLRPSFEKAAGVSLDWFWDQWVTSAKFPKLEIVGGSIEEWNGKRQMRALVRQSGTLTPYRLQFRLVATNGPREASLVVKMTGPESTFDIPVDFVPSQVKIDALGWVLADVGEPFTVGGRR